MTTACACASFVQYAHSTRRRSSVLPTKWCLPAFHNFNLKVLWRFGGGKKKKKKVPQRCVWRICRHNRVPRAECRWKWCLGLALEKLTEVMLLCREKERISFWMNNYGAMYDLTIALYGCETWLLAFQWENTPCLRTGCRKEDTVHGKTHSQVASVGSNH